LIFIQLAHAHRKVAVADPPGATDMAVDRNIVGRISTDQVDGFITQKLRIGACFARIAANEFVTPEHPQVAWLRNSGTLVPIGRDRVLDRGVRAISCALPRLVQNDVNLGQREAGQFDLEIEVDKSLQLDCEHFAVPARIER
jgi:hypothetical protein